MSEKSIAVRQPPRSRAPQTQAEAQAFELLQEVRNLYEQYRREVPGKRKPWPENIKKRILALWDLGISSHQIGSETDIPIQTLYSWRQRIKKQKSKDGFSEIPVVSRKRRTTFQIQQDEERRRSELQLSQLKSSPMTNSAQTNLITITLPNGVKLEGIPMDQVAELLHQVSIR